MNQVRPPLWMWIALCCALHAAMTAPMSMLPIGDDQANWMVLAMAMDEGAVPFRDFKIVNLPGTAYLYLIARQFVADPSTALATVHALTGCALITVGMLWIRQLMSRPAAIGAGLAFALLWPVWLGWWDVAQKDFLAAPWMLFGAAAAYQAVGPVDATTRSTRWAWLVSCGIAAGLAAMFKTPCGIIAPFCIVAVTASLLWQQRERNEGLNGQLAFNIVAYAAAICAGVALAFAPLGIYLSANAAVEDAVFLVFKFAKVYASKDRSSAGHTTLLAVSFLIYYLMPMIVVLALAGLKAEKRWHNGIWFLLPISAALAAFVAQGKGFHYQGLPTFAGCLLLSGAIVGTAFTSSHLTVRLAAGLSVLGTILLAIGHHWTRYTLFVSVFFGFTPRADLLAFHDHKVLLSDESADGEAAYTAISPTDIHAVSAYVRSHSEPGEQIVVWGTRSQIYVQSNRVFAGQACCDSSISNPAWEEKLPEFFANEQVKYLKALHARPPALFIVVHHDANPVEPLPSNESLLLVDGLPEFLGENYYEDVRIGEFAIHARRSQANPSLRTPVEGG